MPNHDEVNLTTNISLAVKLMEDLITPTFVINRDGVVIIWNKACEMITGVEAKTVIGTKKHWMALYDKPRMCLADAVLKGNITDEELSSLYDSHSQPVIDRKGQFLHAHNWCVVPNIPGEKYLSFDAGPIYNECGDIVAVVETISDLTELKNTQIQLEKLATFDGLTGIANRRHFDDQLNSIWLNAQRYKQPLSLLMIDVDYFKQYNDTYGHQEGDDCLVNVANCIDKELKRSLDMAFRYGGEEFAVLLPDTNRTGAYYMAEKIREAISEMALEHTGSQVSALVTVSIGIGTLCPEPGLNSDKLVLGADEALYLAKAEGRNRSNLAT